MNTPFFSIVIPTRNRSQTLEFSIKTILNQSFADFELIVSDNSTNADTAVLIESLNSDKINYYKTSGNLSMSDNWENGLRYVKGKYVLYLGDDDGLLMDALKISHNILVENRTESLIFNWVDYTWPNVSSSFGVSNKLVINLHNRSEKTLSTKQLLKDLVNSKINYYSVPTIYYSFISFSVIQKAIREQGRFFNSVIPDVYSGIIVSYLSTDSFVTNKILGIRGTSSSSNGAAFTLGSDDSAHLRNDFITLNSFSELKWNDEIPFVLCKYAFVLESYFQFCLVNNVRINKLNKAKYYIKLIRRTIEEFNSDENLLNKELGVIEKTVSSNRKLPFLYRFLISFYVKIKTERYPKPLSEKKISNKIFNIDKDALTLNVSNFHVTNILELQLFLNFFLE